MQQSMQDQVGQQQQPQMMQINQQVQMNPQVQMNQPVQMMYSPVRLVYDPSMMMQQEQVQQPQNQNVFVNQPPWARPVQNQVIYVQQIGPNLVPIQQIDPNLYIQQNPYTGVSQMVQNIQNVQQGQIRPIIGSIPHNMVQNFVPNMQGITTEQHMGQIMTNYGFIQANPEVNVVNNVANVNVPSSEENRQTTSQTVAQNAPSQETQTQIYRPMIHQINPQQALVRPQMQFINQLQHMANMQNMGHQIGVVGQISQNVAQISQSASGNTQISQNIGQITQNVSNVGQISQNVNQIRQNVGNVNRNVGQNVGQAVPNSAANMGQIMVGNVRQNIAVNQPTNVSQMPTANVRTSIVTNAAMNTTQNPQIMAGNTSMIRPSIEANVQTNTGQIMTQMRHITHAQNVNIMPRHIPQSFANTSTNDRNVNVNTVLYSAIRNGQPYTYRAIQPKPNQNVRMNFAPRPNQVQMVRKPIPQNMSNVNPNKIDNSTSMATNPSTHVRATTAHVPPVAIKVETDNTTVNRKRKSESPDEVQKKVANFGSITVTEQVKDRIKAKYGHSTSEIGINTSPVRKIEPKVENQQQMQQRIENQQAMQQKIENHQQMQQKIENQQQMQQKIENQQQMQQSQQTMQQKVENQQIMLQRVENQQTLSQKTENQQTMLHKIENQQQMLQKVENQQLMPQKVENQQPMLQINPMESRIKQEFVKTADVGIKTGNIVAVDSKPVKMEIGIEGKVKKELKDMSQQTEAQPFVRKTVFPQAKGRLLENKANSMIKPENLGTNVATQHAQVGSLIIEPSSNVVPQKVENLEQNKLINKVPSTFNQSNSCTNAVLAEIKNLEEIKAKMSAEQSKQPLVDTNEVKDNVKNNYCVQETKPVDNREAEKVSKELIEPPSDDKKPKVKEETTKDVVAKVESASETSKVEKMDTSEPAPALTAVIDEVVKDNTIEKKEYKNISINDMTGKEIQIIDGSITKKERDFVLTHVLDGYVIQESNVPFAIRKPLREKTINSVIDDKQESLRNMPKDDVKDKLLELSHLHIEEANETDVKENVVDKKEGETEKTEIKVEELSEVAVLEKENPFRELKHNIVKTWTVEELTKHLAKHNWTETMTLFNEHEIDGESLFLVTKSQLVTIGVSEDHADIITEFLQKK